MKMGKFLYYNIYLMVVSKLWFKFFSYINSGILKYFVTTNLFHLDFKFVSACYSQSYWDY